jgi:lipoprotein-releasing system ATP-binding protein
MNELVTTPLLRLNQVSKFYRQESQKIEVLKGLDLEIFAGDQVAIVGPSGAGKSTLLHIMGTLDTPSSGEVRFLGQDLFSQSEKERSQFRAETIGFVFQFHHLFGEFSLLENVLMPASLSGKRTKEVLLRAENLISRVGLAHRLTHFPSELSGGELQRAAIARAFLLRPALILADEPTGNLDLQNSLNIQEIFFQMAQEEKATLIVVTHDLGFAKKFKRVLKLVDGQWAS